jgi:hypothetical protein
MVMGTWEKEKDIASGGTTSCLEGDKELDYRDA